MLGVYKVSQNDSIIIYGAGQQGRQVGQDFCKAGYRVIGFIDKRANEIMCCDNLPVMDTECDINKDWVLIITLQDGNKHKEVADYYYERGITKIVMISMNIDGATWKNKIYRETYFKVVNGIVDDISIPLYNPDNNDKGIINVWEDYVSFWLPIKDLYVFSCSATDNLIYDYDKYVSLESLPEYSIKEYRDLFSFLDGNAGVDISDYWAFQNQAANISRDALIRNRSGMFETYKQAIKYDMGFFTDSPAHVFWNGKGAFISKDGLHRIHFLIYVGYSKVPVYCSMEDYKKYVSCQNK